MLKSCVLLIAAVAAASITAGAAAQTEWKPQRPVEIVVPVTAGGGIDRPARVLQKIWTETRMLAVPVTVSNKPGGGQSVGLNYVHQAAGDAHRFALMSSPLLSNYLTGASKLRMLAITAPGRIAGEFGDVPSWKEQGVDVVVSNWRFLTAPAGLSAAQVAWWDALFARTVKSPEWKKVLDEQYWIDDYVPSGAARKYLDQENVEAREILTDLGLVK